MERLITLAACACLCLPLAGQIVSPSLGTVRYPDGSLHSVQGLPANLIVADLPLDLVQAASFSDSGGLVSQNGVIRLLAPNFSVLAEFPSGEKKPLLSFGSNTGSALAWLPGSHKLLHWSGDHFDTLELSQPDLEGIVTDLHLLSPKQVRLLVKHPDDSVSSVTISLRNGNLISSELLPGVRGTATSHDYFIVYAADKQLVVDDLHGYRRDLPLPACDVQMERMSNQWLHLYSPSLRENWAVHLTQAELNISQLPGLLSADAVRRDH